MKGFVCSGTRQMQRQSGEQADYWEHLLYYRQQNPQMGKNLMYTYVEYLGPRNTRECTSMHSFQEFKGSETRFLTLNYSIRYLKF